MKKLIIALLLLSSCQDDPIVPNAPVVINYNGKVSINHYNSLIYINGVQYGNGFSNPYYEGLLKTNDSVRMYHEQIGWVANYTVCSVLLNDSSVFYYMDIDEFDTTIIIQ